MIGAPLMIGGYCVRSSIHFFLNKRFFNKNEDIPHRGYHNTIIDYIKADGTIDYKLIYPSHKIKRKRPFTLGELHWKFERDREFVTPDAFFTMIKNGKIFGETGSVITPDNKIIGDLAVEMGKTTAHHTYLTLNSIPSPTRIDGNVAVIACDAGKNYFHWMFDVLPRLDLISKAGVPFNSIDKFVANKCTNKFQLDTLKVIGIPKSKLIYADKSFYGQASSLLVPSYPGLSGFMPKWSCDFLRRNLLDKTDLKQKKNYPEKIYISRNKKNNVRQISNENEMLNIIKPIGFKTIVLEDMPILEQIRYFAHAGVVLAAHGAGLSNLVFCKPECKVIELFSPNYLNLCFYYLSDLLDLDYAYVLGEGEEPPRFVCPGKGRENITINIELLKKMLQTFVAF